MNGSISSTTVKKYCLFSVPLFPVRNGELRVSERGVEETKMEFIGAIAKTHVADALFIVSDIAMKCKCRHIL